MGTELIQIKHEEMAQIASKFEQNAQKTTQTLQELQRPYQSLKDGGWMGQAANAFYSEMDSKLFPALRRLIQALSQASRATSDISEFMHGADQEASSNFKADAGGGGGGGEMKGAGGGGATAGATNGGLPEGAGVGSGGGTGGGSGGGFDNPSDFGGGFGNPSNGGFTPSSNIGGRPFDVFGGGGSGGDADKAAAATARFQYQSAGGGGAAGGAEGPGGLQFSSIASLMSGAAGGFNGMPLVMAVATPFVALLGKTIKNKIDGS